MDTLGPFALVLATALAWSLLDALRKALSTRIAAETLVLWLVAGQLPVLAFLWGGAPPPGPLDKVYWAVAGLTIALNIGANLALVVALRTGDLSLIIPLLSLTPVAVTLLAIPVLGEWPSWVQALGVVVAVAGAFVLTGASFRRAWSAPGVGLMLTVVACWSLTLPLDKIAVGRAGAALHGVVLCSGVVVGMLAILTFSGRLHDLRFSPRAIPLLSLAVVAATVALLTQLMAIGVVHVGVVETVKRAVGNAGALLIGILAFGEKVDTRRTVGLVTMAVGAGLVVLG